MLRPLTRRRLRYAWLAADRFVWRATRYPLAGWLVVVGLVALLSALGYEF